MVLQNNSMLTAELVCMKISDREETGPLEKTDNVAHTRTMLQLFFQRVKDEFVTSAIHNGVRLSQQQLRSISIEPNQIQFIDGNQYGNKVLYKTNIYVARTLVYYHVDFRSFYRNAYFHSS